MLVSTVTTIALRCAVCGKIDFYALSLFSLSGRNRITVKCDCGAETVAVSNQGHQKFLLQYSCLMCEQTHHLSLSAKELCSTEVLPLKCSETGTEVGFIGPHKKVKTSIRNQDKSLRELAEDLGVVDFFINPEIMYEVLECLHKIAEKGLLYCGCGDHHIDVEVFPDRLELRCPQCSAAGIVFAETDQDLQKVKELQEIELTERRVKYLDRRKAPKKKGVKK